MSSGTKRSGPSSSPIRRVVGGNAVAGGEDAGEVGSHLPVDGDRAFDAEFGSGGRGELGVGANADGDENDVRGKAERRVIGPGGVDLETMWSARACGLDRVDSGVAQHVDVVAVELGADEGAEVGVDGGENFGGLLDLSHR
jgi:hypothetical protein